MLTKRIIACLDIVNGKVVKGIKFNNHEIFGDAIELAKKYSDFRLNELVFYDILASSENKEVDLKTIENFTKTINIPFCVAGNINNIEKVKNVYILVLIKFQLILLH